MIKACWKSEFSATQADPPHRYAYKFWNISENQTVVGSYFEFGTRPHFIIFLTLPLQVHVVGQKMLLLVPLFSWEDHDISCMENLIGSDHSNCPLNNKNELYDYP